MIKIVSLFIFVTAFVWTWSLLTTKNTIGIDVHAGIQSKLAILIQNSIKTKRPNSSNFELNRIYTEKIDDNKIKAYFSYKFSDSLEEDEQVQQIISGEAILNRGLSEDSKVQKWVIQSVKTDVSNLNFKEGLVITSDGKSIVETEPQPATEVETPDKKQSH
ncbi:MAG: hypothetical protein WA160_16195 [Pseudobdellovibrio sp.]